LQDITRGFDGPGKRIQAEELILELDPRRLDIRGKIVVERRVGSDARRTPRAVVNNQARVAAPEGAVDAVNGQDRRVNVGQFREAPIQARSSSDKDKPIILGWIQVDGTGPGLDSLRNLATASRLANNR